MKFIFIWTFTRSMHKITAKNWDEGWKEADKLVRGGEAHKHGQLCLVGTRGENTGCNCAIHRTINTTLQRRREK
jgi:hypothetical protein